MAQCGLLCTIYYGIYCSHPQEAVARPTDRSGLRRRHPDWCRTAFAPGLCQAGGNRDPIDALFTSTSAVCVTGLIAIDTADHFTFFGQAVVAGLIQIGGLGVTSVGIGFILVTGRRVGIKARLLVKEALNVDSFKGIVRLIKAVLLMTLCFEGAGMLLSLIVFAQDYPLPQAIWISIFHSIAAFNNSGFDILGGLRNLVRTSPTSCST